MYRFLNNRGRGGERGGGGERSVGKYCPCGIWMGGGEGGGTRVEGLLVQSLLSTRSTTREGEERRGGGGLDSAAGCLCFTLHFYLSPWKKEFTTAAAAAAAARRFRRLFAKGRGRRVVIKRTRFSSPSTPLPSFLRIEAACIFKKKKLHDNFRTIFHKLSFTCVPQFLKFLQILQSIDPRLSSLLNYFFSSLYFREFYRLNNRFFRKLIVVVITIKNFALSQIMIKSSFACTIEFLLETFIFIVSLYYCLKEEILILHFLIRGGRSNFIFKIYFDFFSEVYILKYRGIILVILS